MISLLRVPQRPVCCGAACLVGVLLGACPQQSAPDGMAAPDGTAAVDLAIDLLPPGCRTVPPESSGCGAFSARAPLGKLPSPLLNEISGIAVSRKNSTAQTSVLWLHNDSGDSARLFAVAVGAPGMPRLVATYRLKGISADDWEDIALGPARGKSGDFLYIGDIGNNFDRRPRRSSIQIYRIPEPIVDLNRSDQQIEVTGAERIDLSYPDGKPYDSEALLIDAQSGEIALLTKELFGGPSFVLRAPPVMTPMGVLPLTLETDCMGAPLALSFPDNERPALTGADLSPAGDAIMARAYTGAYLWNRLPGESLTTALAREPCSLPTVKEAQGEAIGIGPDGATYYTISEGEGANINLFRRD